jgi:hypothetical protein
MAWSIYSKISVTIPVPTNTVYERYFWKYESGLTGLAALAERESGALLHCHVVHKVADKLDVITRHDL